MAKHNTPPPKARNVDFEETDSAAHWGQTPRFLHRKKSKKISCMVYFLSSFPKYCQGLVTVIAFRPLDTFLGGEDVGCIAPYLSFCPCWLTVPSKSSFLGLEHKLEKGGSGGSSNTHEKQSSPLVVRPKLVNLIRLSHLMCWLR